MLFQALAGQVSSESQVSSSEFNTCDLQLRKVINSSSELRFGCSWTLWKDHGVNILDRCLWRVVVDHNLTVIDVLHRVCRSIGCIKVNSRVLT